MVSSFQVLVKLVTLEKKFNQYSSPGGLSMASSYDSSFFNDRIDDLIPEKKVISQRKILKFTDINMDTCFSFPDN